MNQLVLKYGCNPNQESARIYMADGSELPIKILNGRPGYINFLDAFNAWQLVKEIKEATGMAAATSFKHVSPTSAAIGRPLSDKMKKACFVDDIEGLDSSPIACAYARARGTDRLCSFGDFIALSDVCDETTARIIKREVSDGVIAPGYTEKALELLSKKKKGGYNIIEIDPSYEAGELESRQVFGITFEQTHNDIRIDESLLENIVTENRELPDNIKEDLIIGMIALKYTQSNSVCFVEDGQCIGIGAGQQSRIHCTRLAASKADTWHLRLHDKTLSLPFKEKLPRAVRDNVIDAYVNEYEEDVCADGNWQKYFTQRPEPFTAEEKKEYISGLRGGVLASDAFFPFGDSIERGRMSGVDYVVEAGGSVRDDEVIAAADKYNMVMIFNKVRLFHH
ncbi:MAG: phosphoribosylaminoimidazolecarboxamide formyltransferase [Clostridiales bacterium]|nr:phosphoribosylaminoimidazolecarboxamide formyltransferase [Clostridiales bacterium]MDD7035936.1 phosphoribosylaminoimidazolecarboxamide formyltransferase [Bacillota bacterium]MDY2921139.1 phosphoribosylaminoimidazolecarboxamide formyltransferase [Lentihominibacter sp.]